MQYTLPPELIVSDWLDRFGVLAVFGDNSIPYRHFLDNPDTIQISNFKLTPTELLRCKQTHSDLVHIVSRDDAGAGIVIGKPYIPLVDGFISNHKGLFPIAVSADCTPILILAPDVEVVVAVHSGRVGTEKNILGKTLTRMIVEFGANPKTICLKTGPAICEDHYPVDEKTHSEFVKNTGVTQRYPNLDMRKVLLKQAMDTGLLAENIEISPVCTLEHSSYSSYRENKTRERQINFIGYPKDI